MAEKPSWQGANAVGDTIKSKMQRHINHEKFTPGSSRQTIACFKKDFHTGDIKQGNPLSSLLN